MFNGCLGLVTTCRVVKTIRHAMASLSSRQRYVFVPESPQMTSQHRSSSLLRKSWNIAPHPGDQKKEGVISTDLLNSWHHRGAIGTGAGRCRRYKEQLPTTCCFPLKTSVRDQSSGTHTLHINPYSAHQHQHGPSCRRHRCTDCSCGGSCADQRIHRSRTQQRL